MVGVHTDSGKKLKNYAAGLPVPAPRSPSYTRPGGSPHFAKKCICKERQMEGQINVIL